MYSDLIKIHNTAFQTTLSVRLKRRRGHQRKIEGCFKNMVDIILEIVTLYLGNILPWCSFRSTSTAIIPMTQMWAQPCSSGGAWCPGWGCLWLPLLLPHMSSTFRDLQVIWVYHSGEKGCTSVSKTQKQKRQGMTSTHTAISSATLPGKGGNREMESREAQQCLTGQSRE